MPTQLPEAADRPTADGRAPRPTTIILKMLNFQDKVKILQLVKKKKKLEFIGLFTSIQTSLQALLCVVNECVIGNVCNPTIVSTTLFDDCILYS